MLQVTPEFQDQLRALLAAREENAARRISAAISSVHRRRELGAGTFKRLVEFVAGILGEGRPTTFAYEAGCRHGVRSALCLQGWRWEDADLAAASVLSTALMLAGAERPTWQQGQPEFTQDGHCPVERLYCTHCHQRMEPGTRGNDKRFCSHICRVNHTNRVAKISGERVDRASYIASLAVEKKLKIEQLERDCEHCGGAFTPKFTSAVRQRFCSPQCHYDSERMPEKACAQCGTAFRPRLANMKFCGTECSAASMRRKPRECQRCGSSFEPAKSSSTFCSRSCSELTKNERSIDSRRPERECPTCKARFRAKPSSAKTFCSRKCASISRFQCSAVPPEPEGT